MSQSNGGGKRTEDNGNGRRETEDQKMEDVGEDGAKEEGEDG